MQSSDELGTNPMLVCALHGCYGGGGAVQNLNSRKNETYALIHELKAITLLYLSNFVRCNI